MTDILDAAQKQTGSPVSPPADAAAAPPPPIGGQNPPGPATTPSPPPASEPITSPVPEPPLSAPAGLSSPMPEAPAEPTTAEASLVDSVIQASESPPTPALTEENKESLPLEPASPPKKKGVGKGVILSVILLLFVTLPLIIYYTSQRRQIAEIRSRAEGPYPQCAPWETLATYCPGGPACVNIALPICPGAATPTPEPHTNLYCQGDSICGVSGACFPCPANYHCVASAATGAECVTPDTSGKYCKGNTLCVGGFPGTCAPCPDNTTCTKSGSSVECVASVSSPTPAPTYIIGSPSCFQDCVNAGNGSGECGVICKLPVDNGCPSGWWCDKVYTEGTTCADTWPGSRQQPCSLSPNDTAKSGTCCIPPTGGGGTPTPGGGTPGGGGTPTPGGTGTPPAGPQCQNIKILKGSQVISGADLTKLKPGDNVSIVISGTGATKGRVRVNGSDWTESTTTDSTGGFVVPFTIPSGVTNFTVEGELFINGAWK